MSNRLLKSIKKVKIICSFFLLFLVFKSTGFAQVDPNYLISFSYWGNLDFPCDDGDGDYYNSNYNIIYDCTIKIGDTYYTLNSTYEVDGDFEIEVSGTIIYTWEHWYGGEGSRPTTYYDETYTFSKKVVTITMEQLKKAGGCGNVSVRIIEEDTTSCIRTQQLIFNLHILPYEEVAFKEGQKVCSGQDIELNSWNDNLTHEWYAKVNSGDWFSLDINEPDPDVTLKQVYNKTNVDFIPGDNVWFLVDHGCSSFSFEENPISSKKIAYPSPDNPDTIIGNKPSCTDSLDGSFTVGLINGISPTLFQYSLHKAHYVGTKDTKPATCDSDNYAATATPIEDTEDLNHWYCVEAIGGNFVLEDNDNISEFDLALELDIEGDVTGGLNGIFAGDWVIYIRQDDDGDEFTDNFCENYYIRNIENPERPTLTSIDIPSYTYSTSEFSLPYKGANENVKFNYTSETTTNNIIINDGTPISGGQNTGSVNLTEGTYSLKMNDENGCPFEISNDDREFTLSEPDEFKVDSILIDDISCNRRDAGTHDNGGVRFFVSGGVGPYAFSFNNETPVYTKDVADYNKAFSKYFFDKEYGDYPYLITPKYGPEDSINTISIGEPDSLLIFELSRLLPKCQGFADGEIRLSGAGGTGRLEFFLDDYSKLTGMSPFQEDTIQKLDQGQTYELKIRDENSCKDSIPFTLEGHLDSLRYSIIDSDSEVCPGGNDGSIELKIEGGHQDLYDNGSVNFLYPISFFITTENITGSLETTVLLDSLITDTAYVVKISESKCLITDTFKVTGYSSPLGFTKEERIPPNCIGGNDGSVQLQGFGGHEPIYDNTYFSLQDYSDATFSTQLPQITISDLNGDSIYTVIIDDNAGCITKDTIYLGEEPNPVQALLLDSAEERCFEYADGWIQVSATSGEKPLGGYNYYLTDENDFTTNLSDSNDTTIVKSGDDAIFYNLPPGLHNIYVDDENDCLNVNVKSTRDAYKTEFYVDAQDLIQSEYEVHNSSTIGSKDGYIKVALSGGNDKYEYQIKDKTSDLTVYSGVVDTGFISGYLKEGDYSLQFKDTCGCANSNLEWISYDFNIIDPADSLGMDVIRVTEPSCYGYSDGKIEVKAKDGWGDYIYGVNGVYYADTYGELIDLLSGWQNVCVKDKEGAEYCTMVFIDQPDTLLPLVESITDVQCNEGSDGIVALGAIGGTMPYQYSPDNINWQTDSSLTGFSKGVYTLYIMDAHQCQVSTTAEIDHPDAFSISYNITNTTCGESHGAIECNVTGGTTPYTYSWFMIDTDGEHPVSCNTSTPDNLAGGKYKVYVSDAHLCDTSWIFIVNNTDGPVLSINGIDSVSCSGMADGAIHYAIEEGLAPYYVELQSGINIISTVTHENSGTFSFSNLEDGLYRIMVRDANACVQSSTELLINFPNPVEILLDTLIHPVCYAYSNGQISVHAEGGNGNYSYLWNTGEADQEIKDLGSGTYSVRATDAKGCFSESAYELIEPKKLSVDIGDEATVCEGQIYPLSAEAYETYNWTYNGEYISSAEGIEVWAEGIYALEVSDQNGCFASDTFELFVSNDLLVAEFIMPSEAFENDTVIAIDISWPEPENVTWSFSEGIINVSSETYLEEFTFESPGTYTVNLISQKAMCLDSISKQIVVMADTSSSEKSIFKSSLIENYKVYPNPNNGVFSVDIDLSDYEDVVIDIYDIQRNVVITRQKAHNQKFYQFEFGFSNLNQGLYLIVLSVGDEQKTEKILVL